MNKFTCFLFLAIILTTGCVHETPLTTEHTIAIDPELQGLWELVSGEARGDPDEDRMMIIAWSDTEYLVQFPLGAEGDFFRAYPVEIGGHSLIQAEYVGNYGRGLYPPEETFFPIISYGIVEGVLIVRSLNSEVVDDKITDSELLRKTFLNNKDRQDLFHPPAHYRRVEHK